MNTDDVKGTLEAQAIRLENAASLVTYLEDSLDHLRREAEKRRLREWTAGPREKRTNFAR